MMNMLHVFTEGFCCIIPCPIGLMLFAIPLFVLKLRRRKVTDDASHAYQEIPANSNVEA